MIILIQKEMFLSHQNQAVKVDKDGEEYFATVMDDVGANNICAQSSYSYRGMNAVVKKDSVGVTFLWGQINVFKIWKFSLKRGVIIKPVFFNKQ